MKLLIVTSLKEYQQTVANIFQKAEIKVFSVSETIGFKDDHTVNLLDSWFTAGKESFDSVFIFSFTGDNNAENALRLIKEYNKNNESDYPVRAFIVPVEEASYSFKK